MIDGPALPFGYGGLPDLPHNGLKRVCVAVDSGGQRPAAKGSKADAAHPGGLSGPQWHAVVVEHQQGPVTLDDGPFGGEIERGQGDTLALDIAPDIELDPVRQGKTRTDSPSLSRVL